MAKRGKPKGPDGDGIDPHDESTWPKASASGPYPCSGGVPLEQQADGIVINLSGAKSILELLAELRELREEIADRQVFELDDIEKRIDGILTRWSEKMA